MREKLKDLYGQRLTFTATIEVFGSKPGFKGRSPVKTVLLRDVYLNGDIITDHLWMIAGKWSDQLTVGDTFTFDARVGQYVKGYRGRRRDWDDALPLEIDYQLQRPTNICITNPSQLTLNIPEA